MTDLRGPSQMPGDAARGRRLESRLPGWMPARFLRFGIVGGLGTVVNLVVLWLAQEWLLRTIEPPTLRLNLSLALSIALSTVHNFAWNRRWTWADRRAERRHNVIVQFAQYALACWFGILLQFIFTRVLADEMHYLLAATLAIGVASVANFFVNDLWTFGTRWIATPSTRRLVLFHAGLVTLAVWAYANGLDSRFAPKNGDEFVYAHIARLTAATGQWLPLASELDGMRNTKPPLLFWQGMASTGWGSHWTLERLRWPSVLYTLLTALMIGLVAVVLAAERRRPLRPVGFDPVSTGFSSTISGSLGAAGGPAVLPQVLVASAPTPVQPAGRPGLRGPVPAAWTVGVAAGLVFLGFFTSFRYGRPFLTNAPETFWLALPLLALLAAGPRAFESRLAVPLAIGVSVGLGLLYKSFALLAPVGAVLALWWLDHRGWRLGEALRRDTHKLLLVAAVSLGLFAMWFVLDPDPAAVWREFVVGENVGKLGAGASSALEAVGRFFWGSSSVWEYAAAAVSNAGLWFAVVLTTGVVAWRRRAIADATERRLWLWLAVFFVVFAIPSQRSARYLLPAMPALALLVALHWRSLPRWAFAVGHALGLAIVIVLMWLALGLQDGSGGDIVYHAVDWAMLLLAATVCLGGLALPGLSRGALLASAPLVYGVIAVFTQPIDGPAGRYGPEVQQRVAGQTVWVPCNFRGKFEDHGFLLPASTPRGYATHEGPLRAIVQEPVAGPAALADRYPLFAWRQGLSSPPPRCEGCTVIASRVDLRSRHSSAELKAMLAGRVQENLYLREWLIAAAPRPSHAAHAGDSACR
ncbi:MAG: GtrA family protein [Ideonella sp.]|nr:GtrA family protein [Ideonella sp.]